MVQWLDLGTFIALGLGLIPGRGAGISEAARLTQKKTEFNNPQFRWGKGL